VRDRNLLARLITCDVKEKPCPFRSCWESLIKCRNKNPYHREHREPRGLNQMRLFPYGVVFEIIFSHDALFCRCHAFLAVYAAVMQQLHQRLV
jgi:hypothetical protein